jgi:hypothetical protein
VKQIVIQTAIVQALKRLFIEQSWRRERRNEIDDAFLKARREQGYNPTIPAFA